MIAKDGSYQFEKDKEAVHSYFVDYVNQNTVFFHDLEEKNGVPRKKMIIMRKNY